MCVNVCVKVCVNVCAWVCMNVYVRMCVWMCLYGYVLSAYVCRCLQKPEVPSAVVTGMCKPSDVDSGTRTYVLCRPSLQPLITGACMTALAVFLPWNTYVEWGLREVQCCIMNTGWGLKGLGGHCDSQSIPASWKRWGRRI